jgi:hypothetical protein
MVSDTGETRIGKKYSSVECLDDLSVDLYCDRRFCNGHNAGVRARGSLGHAANRKPVQKVIRTSRIGSAWSIDPAAGESGRSDAFHRR